MRYREDKPGDPERARAAVAEWREQNPAGTGEQLIEALGSDFHPEYGPVLRAALFAVDRTRQYHTGPAMTTWDVFTGSATVPSGALTELAALRAALPGYDVIITSHSRTYRFEATCRGDGPGTWCVISSEPADLWRELAGRAQPAALDGDSLDRALLMARFTIGTYPLELSLFPVASPPHRSLPPPPPPYALPPPPPRTPPCPEGMTGFTAMLRRPPFESVEDVQGLLAASRYQAITTRVHTLTLTYRASGTVVGCRPIPGTMGRLLAAHHPRSPGDRPAGSLRAAGRAPRTGRVHRQDDAVRLHHRPQGDTVTRTGSALPIGSALDGLRLEFPEYRISQQVIGDRLFYVAEAADPQVRPVFAQAQTVDRLRGKLRIPEVEVNAAVPTIARIYDFLARRQGQLRSRPGSRPGTFWRSTRRRRSW